jgi:acyl-CoA synthetase (AMP-forming)/AMP-acid ligase II
LSLEIPAATLLEALQNRAHRDPDQGALVFEGDRLSIGQLWQDIESVAAVLLRRGLDPGDRVVLVCPNGIDFFPAFYGVQRAGGIAVPVFPDSGPDRIADIAAHSGSGIIVISSALPDARQPELCDLEDTAGVAVVKVGDCIGTSPHPGCPTIDPDRIAYIQYTSGSTGNPKGVQLSHADLVTNIEQMIAGFEITVDDVFVSWLPVSHDMGLILMTMTPLAIGARMVLMPTSVASIRRWMTVISEHRGTFTAAPDFAYRIAVRTASAPDALDLSCLRVALNAAEPVRSGTIADFETRYGLGPTIVPAYGLAEATVGVAGWRPRTPFKTDDRGLVSVGRPFPDIEVEIHGEDGPLAPGEVGEIVVRSPAVTRGYFRNPDATAELLEADGSMHTGDIGYLDADGDLYIVGRSKSVIIQAGRTIAPQEIEETVDALDFVRRSAAVGIDRGGPEGEQAWVFAELRPADAALDDRHGDMIVDLVRAVHRRLGRRPGRVYLLQARSIPTTHNGKVQHDLLRRRYLEGELEASGRIIYPRH